MARLCGIDSRMPSARALSIAGFVLRVLTSWHVLTRLALARPIVDTIEAFF
jgi:hypothetical protein